MIDFDAGAERVFNDCKDQVAVADGLWRDRDPEGAAKMTVSLVSALTQLLTWGNDARISRDGALSLYVTTPSIDFGIIFHPRDRRVMGPRPEHTSPSGLRAPFEGLYCFHRHPSGAYCMAPFHDPTGPTCSGHEPEPFAMPLLGEWSFHS